MRVCTRCKKQKLLEDFYQTKICNDRHFCWCKDCCCEYNKKYSQEYDKKHKIETKLYAQDYYLKHKKEINHKVLVRECNNREKTNYDVRQRDYKKRNALGTHTLNEWLDLCRKYGFRCLRCGKKKPLTEDHIVPLSKGGSNYISNIQPLCRDCNSSKHTKIIDYRSK